MRQYLALKLGYEFQIKQSTASSSTPMIYTDQHRGTAVARGAVLQMLKACEVKERILRRHYGVTTTRLFRKEKDPKQLKILSEDGWQCASVMFWLATKVSSSVRNVIVGRTGSRRNCAKSFLLLSFV